MIYDKPIIALDIFATVAAVANYPVAEDKLDGINLIPFLKGKNETPHPVLYWSYRNRSALRTNHWKLVSSTTQWDGEKAPWSLYNLQEDTNESKDLASQHPKKLQELKNLWEALNRDISNQ